MDKEEKILDLLEILAVDMKEVKEKLDKKVDKLDIVEFENRVMDRFGTLFDGHTQVDSKIDRVENTVNDIANKVNNQEVEIRVLKAVK